MSDEIKQPALTARESQIVATVAEGLSNKEIAERLGISTETVKEHVQNCLRKLNLENRTHLAVWHTKKSLVTSFDPQTVYIVFGAPSTLRENQDRCINEYRFDSLPELNAFLKGLDAADGWSEYHQADTREEALAYIKEVTADHAEEEEDDEEAAVS